MPDEHRSCRVRELQERRVHSHVIFNQARKGRGEQARKRRDHKSCVSKALNKDKASISVCCLKVSECAWTKAFVMFFETQMTRDNFHIPTQT